MTRGVRRLARALVGLLLGLLSFGLLLGSPAQAADGDAVIDHAQPTKDAVRLLVSVPGADAIDYGNVKVRIDNADVNAEAAAASESADVRRTAILTIDTSNSMAGQRIAEAKRAALAYLSTVPDNVKVGVVTFDNTVEERVAPTLDRAAAERAVNGLTLRRSTALYDGVIGALKAAGPGGVNAGQRKLLILSDGKDTTNTNLGDVLTEVKSSGATVDVVSLQQGDEANQPLNAIASAGEGTMLTAADPAALTAAFQREADALARQILVTAAVPDGLDSTSSNVEVSVPTAAETYTTAAYVPVRTAADLRAEEAAAAAPRPVRASPFEISRNMVLAGVGAIGVGLLGVIVVLAVGGRKPDANYTLSEHMQAYGAMAGPGQAASAR